jgi:hypothetical protein
MGTEGKLPAKAGATSTKRAISSFDLAMRLKANIKVKYDLVETGALDLFQGVAGTGAAPAAACVTSSNR